MTIGNTTDHLLIPQVTPPFRICAECIPSRWYDLVKESRVFPSNSSWAPFDAISPSIVFFVSR